MAVVGTPSLMDLNTPSNADMIRQALAESEAINLYPEAEPLTEAEQYIKNLQESYETTMGSAAEASRAARDRYYKFLEDSKSDLLTLGIFSSVVSPVLESQYATERESDMAIGAIQNFVAEQGTEELLTEFKHKNLYLAELADTVNKHYEALAEKCECKIKEGLTEKDVCDIEDADIKSFVVDCGDCVPKKITDNIFKRVEGAISDFIDDKRKNQYKIKRAYDDAKAKVDEYNQAQQVVDKIKQIDAETGSEDPEVAIDDNLNTKLDAQNQMDIMAQNDPMGTNPVDIGAQPGVGMTPQMEAMASARATESEVLEECYNVYDGMLRIMVESCHKTASIKQQYLKEDGKGLDISKLMHDTRALYTVLEGLNSIGIIEADEAYLKNMLHEMWEDSENQADEKIA